MKLYSLLFISKYFGFLYSISLCADNFTAAKSDSRAINWIPLIDQMRKDFCFDMVSFMLYGFAFRLPSG